jgi:hypothetical protein
MPTWMSPRDMAIFFEREVELMEGAPDRRQTR